MPFGRVPTNPFCLCVGWRNSSSSELRAESLSSSGRSPFLPVGGGEGVRTFLPAGGGGGVRPFLPVGGEGGVRASSSSGGPVVYNLQGGGRDAFLTTCRTEGPGPTYLQEVGERVGLTYLGVRGSFLPAVRSRETRLFTFGWGRVVGFLTWRSCDFFTFRVY